MGSPTDGSALGGDPQVLVVGAGPVGLTAAHELARHGVRVRLVDAAPGPAVTSRALATHARTLETYDHMGVIDDLLPRGQRVEHFTLHQNGRRLIRFDTDYSGLPTRFPFTLMVDQVITEEVLRTAAAERGVDVEWGLRLAGFEDTGERVRAILEHADGRVEEVVADWLLGTDGGHSTVRKSLGLQLVGESSETWLIADAVVECDLPRDSIHWMRTPAGTVMMVPFPEPGKWRLLDTADVDYDADVPGDGERIARRFADKIHAGIGHSVRVAEPSWISVFTIQQRMIDRMRVGRCFVAGDAAHVHSPASGQGLNTGVQDAFNLAWKLAAVVRGEAAETLLDSYSAERVPVGAELLRSTKFATVLIQLKSRLFAGLLRAAFTVLRRATPIKGRVQRKIMGGMSALGLTYEHGAVHPAAGPDPVTAGRPALPALPVGPGARAARVTGAGYERSVGWREFLAQLREPGWTLLAAPAAVDEGLRALVRLHPDITVRTVLSDPGADGAAPGPLADPDGVLRADLDLAAAEWLLIRPDGYVAATGPGDAGQALTALGLTARGHKAAV
ncbi:FAD-dependent oxidoreductase [Streptomyces virginiae]|uniref:FAD-dependent oxidoreductase n=1 Tax=Streptomyces virginiae TaxID=1961 RepID=UPI0022529CF9|nr:FAD-dependent oxidoreductase [Streptomyces virginiae]MCX4957487.1 FAD-dependent oxidoreductase [Streptomyces virginiae]